MANVSNRTNYIMTNVFISHSSRDSKIATRLYYWLKNFQLVKDIWIDIRELKPGMELEESIIGGINKSDIVIIIVSSYSKGSKWVKKEIKYSLKFQERREKIVVPVLYKIKPERVTLHNIHYQKLLRNIYVPLDDRLFNIHRFIPSLIPEYHCLEIPFNNQFHIDIPQLISNLKYSFESQRKIYPVINHEKIDREINTILKESLSIDHSGFESNPQEIIEDERKLENVMTNFLPLYWLNISFVLSIYIQSLQRKTSLEIVATSIYNLFRELFYRLFLYFFDEVSLSYSTNKGDSGMKKLILESRDFVFPRGSGLPIYFYFICNLYYNNRVTPNRLVELNFVGEKVRPQKGRVRSDNYKNLMHNPQPAIPLYEVFDSDWYEIIVPQFLSGEIMRPTRELHTFTQADLDQIGLHISRYSKLYNATYSDE